MSEKNKTLDLTSLLSRRRSTLAEFMKLTVGPTASYAELCKYLTRERISHPLRNEWAAARRSAISVPALPSVPAARSRRVKRDESDVPERNGSEKPPETP